MNLGAHTRHLTPGTSLSSDKIMINYLHFENKSIDLHFGLLLPTVASGSRIGVCARAPRATDESIRNTCMQKTPAHKKDGTNERNKTKQRKSEKTQTRVYRERMCVCRYGDCYITHEHFSMEAKMATQTKLHAKKCRSETGFN